MVFTLTFSHNFRRLDFDHHYAFSGLQVLHRTAAKPDFLKLLLLLAFSQSSSQSQWSITSCFCITLMCIYYKAFMNIYSRTHVYHFCYFISLASFHCLNEGPRDSRTQILCKNFMHRRFSLEINTDKVTEIVEVLKQQSRKFRTNHHVLWT